MKTILDLTNEQAIEIAKLIYPWPDEMEKIQIVKHPFLPEHYDDAREFVRIYFEGPMMGDNKFPAQIEILSNLDVFASYRYGQKHSEKDGKEIWKEIIESIPIRNQYEIQKRFREWGIVPSQKNHIIKLGL
jgi:hypothetical protein